MKTSLINKTIQNATLIEKYIKKDLFEKQKIIIQNIEPTIFIDLFKEYNNSLRNEIIITMKNKRVYKTSLAVDRNKIIFLFKTQDWKNEEDYSIEMELNFDLMNVYTLEYTYEIITKYVEDNIEEIFDAVEREKKLEAINTFKINMVA